MKADSPIPRFFAALLLGAGFLLASGQSSAQAPDQATSPTARVVRFRATGELQLDVWLDGQRAGITPFEKKLAPGTYFVTAGTEGIEPLIQDFEITGRPNQLAFLPASPVTTESYARSLRELTSHLRQRPEHPHLLMLSALLVADQQERELLLTQLGKVYKEEDFLEKALRARVLLERGREEAAWEEAGDAVELNRDFAYGWRTLAVVLAQRGELEEALGAAHKAVMLEPNAWRNLRVRAVVYSKKGMDRQAEKDMEIARELFERFMKAKAPQQ